MEIIENSRSEEEGTTARITGDLQKTPIKIGDVRDKLVKQEE